MTNLSKSQISEFISKKALEFGFSACGFAPATFLQAESEYLSNYIAQNRNGNMQFMEKNTDKRINPALLADNIKSVICVLIPYHPGNVQPKSKYKIANYAMGTDYHLVIKQKLQLLFNAIKEQFTEFDGRVFTDSAPIMEKAFARIAGLGWTGKNTLLLNNTGSFHFLGEIICNIELDYCVEQKNNCGSCTKCIDNCPTKALQKPYILDAEKCIAYQTIENDNEIPAEFAGKMNNYIYGCDICQNVCPYNKHVQKTNIIEFQANEIFLNKTDTEWENLTNNEFNIIFKKSAIKRIKYENFMKNIHFISKK